MRQEAIELIVALKGHTLPKGAENAYNRFCKAIAEEEKQDVEQSSTESKVSFDQPVAWMCSDESLLHKGYSRFSRNCEGAWNIPVYTTPPQRKWVGLTDEEINDCDPQEDCWGLHEVARAIEAKLKEKNT